MAKPDVYPCDECGAEVKQTPGPGRIRKTCQGGCKVAPPEDVPVDKQYARWKVRTAGMSFTDVSVAQTRGYILGMEDVLKDIMEAKDLSSLEETVEMSLHEAQDTLAKLLGKRGK